MHEISMNINKELDVSSIKHLLVKGESLADTVKIKIERVYEGIDLKDKVFTLKTQNSAGVYYEKVLIKEVGESLITLGWVVTRAFTSTPGSLKITLHISDSSGYSLATKATEVNVAHSVFIATPIAPTDVLEDYLQEIRVCSESASNSAEQSLKILTDMNSKIVDDFTSTAKDKSLSANKGRELNNRINNLVGQTGNSNTEIVDARNSPERNTIYATLKDRLDAVDGDIVKSKFSAPTTVTAPIISLPSTAVKGKMEGSIKGNTLYQAVTNGDFASGTTGWTASNSTISVLNKILSNTASGVSTNVYSFRTVPFMSGVKYFVKVRTRVNNSVCTALRLGTNISVLEAITSPVLNQWYDLFDIYTATTDTAIRVTHIYPDTATANGKVMEIDGNVGVFAIPITGTPYENWTADQLNNLINGYWEGLQGTREVGVKAIGKNLIPRTTGGFVQSGLTVSTESDGSVIINGTSIATVRVLIGVNTRHATSLQQAISPNSIVKLNNSKQYTFSRNLISGTATGDFGNIIADKNQNLILNNTIDSGVLLTSSDIYAIYFSITAGITFNNYKCRPMLNEGSTALPYEPYTETELFCPVELGSVPSTQDEFTFDGKFIQRTKEYVLQSGDISGLITNLTNLDYIALKLPQGCINGGDSSGEAMISEKTSPSLGQGIKDLVSNVWKHYLNPGNWIITVPKGTYANLAAAQTALAGTKIRYQLAEPVETQYPASNLIAEPSGTIYVDSMVKVVKPYKTNITLDVKIKNLTSVTKVDGENRVPILLSLVNVASDGMSLTILNASSGSLYELEYETFGATLPTVEYSYPLNLNAQVQGNTEQLKNTDKILQDFLAYQNAVNAQVDLRLVLLERM